MNVGLQKRIKDLENKLNFRHLQAQEVITARVFRRLSDEELENFPAGNRQRPYTEIETQAREAYERLWDEEWRLAGF